MGLTLHQASFLCGNTKINSTSTHNQSNNMAAPAAAQPKTTYLDMVVESIQALKDRKGASRAAIKKGLESGVLKEGQTPQRFRIDQLPKVKKATPKKSGSSKKKTAKKTATKKKTTPKKSGSGKKNGSKKKTGSGKQKTGSKKKSQK